MRTTAVAAADAVGRPRARELISSHQTGEVNCELLRPGQADVGLDAPPKNHSIGKKWEGNILALATYSRPSVTRACCVSVPARRSYPCATRARSLFLLVWCSYSVGYPLLGVLATPSWGRHPTGRAVPLPVAPTCMLVPVFVLSSVSLI